MAQHRNLNALAQEIHGRSSIRGSVLLLAILLFLGAMLAWASMTEIDDVTRADGRIVPSGNIQVIEAAETATLETLFVKEGQIVDQGDLLMELDGIMLASRFNQEQQRAFGLMARIERLEAEIEARTPDFSPLLMEQAPDVIRSETALFRGRLEQLETQVAIYETQRAQRAQELEEATVDLRTAEETLAIVAEERALVQPLVDRGLEAASVLLGLRRSETEWSGRKHKAIAGLKRMESALAEIDDQIEAQRSEYRADALTDLALATAELAALEPALPALESRAARAQIISPVRGVVNRIHQSTVGSTARAGEELIEIVPLDDNLLVEAYVRPSDIAFLSSGQNVKVKITAYDYSRYGSLEGEITRIGADTITRSDHNDEQVFVIEVSTSGAILDADGAAVQITPGMVAEVDILTGRKSVLEYLIQPVIRVKDRAFRD